MPVKRLPPGSRPASAADGPLTTTSTRVRVEETTRSSLLDDERGRRVVLPPDHPAWRRDRVSLSKRALLLLGRLKPFVIRVMTFWDHRITSAELDQISLEIDASGSYRTR